MDILLSTNNTTLTFHTIEAVNINKERHHTCSIYMEWNTVFSPTYPTWALVGGLQGQPVKLYYAFKIYFRATLQFSRYDSVSITTDWLGGERAGVGRGLHGPHPDRGQHRDQVCSVQSEVELQTKVPEDFTITEKAYYRFII